MAGVESSDAAELAAIRDLEGQAAVRRAALAAKWGTGAIVMDAPGAPEATVVIKGQLQVVKVYYLSGGPPP
jgi:hypothetical protein